jgi:sulfide dehydrogenase cytochrome subunit
MLLASLALVFSTSAFAGDKKKPETITGASTDMLSNTCAGCHGTKGVSMGPSIPTIAGMSSAYLVETMEGYKSGDIPSTIMGRLAKGYSSDEIKQMGEYFAKQEFVAAKGQEFDPEKAKKGAKIHKKYCEKCHSEDGTVADDDSGFLKGQWKAYLNAQMMDFHNKDRNASKKMAKKMKKMYKKKGSAGVEALVDFYSSDK